jgi:LacI family transcriptional regulator
MEMIRSLTNTGPAANPPAISLPDSGENPIQGGETTRGSIIPKMPPPRRTTIKDIARTAGLSTATVSQALRPQPKSNIKLPPDTVERVKAVALQLNYHPHTGARSIRSNSFSAIGYFIAKTGQFTNTPYGYMAGVHDVAEEREFRMTLIRLPMSVEDISKAMPSVFSEQNLDAIVIESYSELAYQIYERIQASGLPVIFVNDRHETNSVYVDDEWGAMEVTRHLIDKGYQRICFLHRQTEGGPSIEKMHHSAIDRETGYRKAMLEAGRHALCHTVYTRDVVGLDVELGQADWEVISRHDAVIAYDDDLANLIGRAAYDRHLRIPDSLAIASFNGDYASLSAWQRLTTVRVPSYEMGRKAAEMAFELVASGADTALPSSAHRPTLVLGQTT